MILSLIKRIRDSFDNSVTVYTNGSCVKFAMILKEVYPQGNILYDQNHAIFELNGKCYDINGYATKTKNHIKLEEYGELMIKDIMKLKFKP